MKTSFLHSEARLQTKVVKGIQMAIREIVKVRMLIGFSTHEVSGARRSSQLGKIVYIRCTVWDLMT